MHTHKSTHTRHLTDIHQNKRVPVKHLTIFRNAERLCLDIPARSSVDFLDGFANELEDKREKVLSALNFLSA